MSELTQFDRYLGDDGPAALVIREHLMPVEGADGVLFPATYVRGGGRIPRRIQHRRRSRAASQCLPGRQRRLPGEPHRTDVRRGEGQSLSSRRSW